MGTRPTRADHDAAVARRLEQLSAELAGVRDGEGWTAATVAPQREADLDAAPVATVPVPGRHAARRPRGTGDGWVPEPLRGRVVLGPAQVAVVAVLVALGLAVTTWWVVRAEPQPITPVAPADPAPAEALATPSDRPSVGAASAAEGTVTVDVTGRVRRPGIVVLDAGSRVVDAVEAAGGARPGVELGGLNLARLLVDGEQVVVGVPVPVAAPPSAPSASLPPGAPVTGTSALVNLNTADLAQLETLPEVGPVTAQAIVTWRESNGGFTAVEELLEVDGIGEATLASMAPFCTV